MNVRTRPNRSAVVTCAWTRGRIVPEKGGADNRDEDLAGQGSASGELGVVGVGWGCG